MKTLGLKRRGILLSVYILGFIGDFNMAMISIIAILKATVLNADTVQVGWIGTAYGLSYCFMPIIMGRISDTIPRRSSLIISTTLQSIAASLLIFALRTNDLGIFYPFIIIILVGLGIAYSFYWPTIEAFISEYTEHSERAHEKAFSNFCIWWGLGIALGAWVGGILSEKSQLIIGIIALVMALFALSISIYIVPETSKEHEERNDDEISENNIGSNTSDVVESEKSAINPDKISPRILVMILLANFMFAINARLISTYFANYAKLYGGLNYSGSLIGSVTLIFALFRMIYFYIGRFLPKNFINLSISSLLAMVALLVIYSTKNFIWIVISLCLLGLMNGLTYYIALLLLMKFEKAEKGTKAGLFEAMVGIGSSITPIIAGSLALVSLSFPFLIFAIFSGVIGLIQLIITRSISKNADQQ